MSFGVPTMYIDVDAKAPQHLLPCRHAFGHDQAKLPRLLERPSFSWLLYANPEDLIEIFPAKSAMIEAVLGTIVVRGAYWSKSHLAKQDVATKLKQEIHGSGNWTEFWREMDRVLTGMRRFDGVVARRRGVESPWLLFALCLEFTVDVRVGQKEFRRLPQDRKDIFRDEIREEMGNIDDKIDTMDYGYGERFKRDTTRQCARAEMYIRSAALIDLEPFRKLLVRHQADEELEHSQIQVIKSEPGFEAAGDLLIALHKWEISHLPLDLPKVGDVSPKETPGIFGQVFQRT
jgi:hypothetical protein